jgi:hypothetical protein
MFKNSRKQGDAGLGQAIAWFTMKGYAVCIPLTDNQDYDLVVEIDGALRKVQVKSGSTLAKSGAALFYLSVNGGNKSGDTTTKTVSQQTWDYLFGYHLTTKQVIFIPKDEVHTEGQLQLGDKYKEWIH